MRKKRTGIIYNIIILAALLVVFIVTQINAPKPAQQGDADVTSQSGADATVSQGSVNMTSQDSTDESPNGAAADNPAQQDSAANPAQQDSADNPVQTDAGTTIQSSAAADNPAQQDSADNPAQQDSADNPAQTDAGTTIQGSAAADNPAQQDTAANPAQQDTADNPAPESVRVGAMRGPTGIGLVKLMQDNDDGLTGLHYDFFIGTIDEIIPRITTGALDIAAVPANLAAVLYNNTGGGVRVIAVNTLGVLYMVERGDTIHSVADLRGKTFFVSGKGATPEYALNYVLEKNGVSVDDLDVVYKSEPAEILQLLMSGSGDAAFLPQPFASMAIARVDGLRLALDWTAEWDKLGGNSGGESNGDGGGGSGGGSGSGSDSESALISSVLVARAEFIQSYPDAVSRFLQESCAAAAYANDNTDGAAVLCGKYEIIDENVAKGAIPLCNIVHITGSEMTNKLRGYLAALEAQNPKSVGGKAPDVDFYYEPEINQAN